MINDVAAFENQIRKIMDWTPLHGFPIPTSVEEAARRCLNSLRSSTETLDASLCDLQRAADVHGRTRLEQAFGARLEYVIKRYEAIRACLEQLEDENHPAFTEMPSEPVQVAAIQTG